MAIFLSTIGLSVIAVTLAFIYIVFCFVDVVVGEKPEIQIFKTIRNYCKCDSSFLYQNMCYTLTCIKLIFFNIVFINKMFNVCLRVLDGRGHIQTIFFYLKRRALSLYMYMGKFSNLMLKYIDSMIVYSKKKIVSENLRKI